MKGDDIMGYKEKKWKREEKRDKNEVLTIRLNLTYRDIENLTKLLLSSNQEKIEKIEKINR